MAFVIDGLCLHEGFILEKVGRTFLHVYLSKYVFSYFNLDSCKIALNLPCLCQFIIEVYSFFLVFSSRAESSSTYHKRTVYSLSWGPPCPRAGTLTKGG